MVEPTRAALGTNPLASSGRRESSSRYSLRYGKLSQWVASFRIDITGQSLFLDKQEVWLRRSRFKIPMLPPTTHHTVWETYTLRYRN